MHEPASAGQGRARFSSIVVALPAALLLFYLCRSALLLISHDWDAVSFPYVLDYGEGPVLDQVMRLARLQNIYLPNPAPMQYTVSNYPPVYHLAQLPFAWFTGPAYWYGRAISAISVLAASALIGMTLYTVTKDRLAAIVGALTLLAIPYVASWSPLCRVDSLALALSWAGLFVAARWPKRRGTPLICAAFLTAAIYTRQSYALAAPLGALIWLAKEGSLSQAVKLAAWVVAFCLGLFLALNLMTHGGFYFNTVTANVNRFYWSTVALQARGSWGLMPFLIMIGIAYVLAAWRFKTAGYWLAAPYLLASAVSAAAIGKVGSNVNYLYELSAGLSFMAGAVIAALGTRWRARGVLLAVLAVQAIILFGATKQTLSDDPANQPGYRENSALLMSEIRIAEGPVLADTFMGLLPLAGRPLTLQPFEYKQLSMSGEWDENPLVEDIVKKKFALIVLYAPTQDIVRGVWTRAQLKAVTENYRRAEVFGSVIVYKPLQAPVPASGRSM